MGYSDSRTEISSTKSWPDVHGLQCKIVETITKTFGLVEGTDERGLVWLLFDGACVSGGGYVWNEAGVAALDLQLMGKVGAETHHFNVELGKGCEDVSCHIHGTGIAEGAVSGYVEGGGTNAMVNVTIAFPDNPPIQAEVDVDPKLPDEKDDHLQIAFHGSMSGSGSVTAAGPVGPGAGTGTGSGSGTVNVDYVWRKKGPNKEMDPLSAQTEIDKDCTPAPVMRVSSNCSIDLSADTWWPRGCGARISFEHVTIDTSCSIECTCPVSSRTVGPRGGEFASARPGPLARQQLATLDGKQRALANAGAALLSQRDKMEPAAANDRIEAAVYGNLADQVERLASSVVSEAQWNELDRLRGRLARQPLEPQKRLAALAAIEIKLARIEAHGALLHTLKRAINDGYQFSPEQFAAILAPTTELANRRQGEARARRRRR
jgi:hypothetical protein